MDTPTQDDPIKVDLEKGSSKDFEIRTMADDLNGSPSKTVEVSTPKITYQPPASPVSAPIHPVDTPPPINAPEVMPVPPSIPSAPSQPIPPDLVFDDEPSSGGWLKSFLLGFVLVLLLGVIGIGSWWWYSNNGASVVPTPTPTPTPIPTPTPQPDNEALVPVDKTITLEISAQDDRAAFFEKLSSLLSTSSSDLAMDQVVNVRMVKNGELLTTSELGALAGIDFAPYGVGEKFTLVFSVPQSDPVLGLVLEVNDADATKSALLAMEAELPGIASQLYSAYTKEPLAPAASSAFLENIYQGVPIRYLNFSAPQRAIDYALHEDLLLLAGSREMIFTLIDVAKLVPVLREE